MIENLELMKITDTTDFNTANDIMQKIIDAEAKILIYKNMIKEVDEYTNTFKTTLFDLMSKYDVKSIDNEKFKITRIDETTRTIIDSKKLKDEQPNIYNDYSKTSKVKGYVKINLKGEF